MNGVACNDTGIVPITFVTNLTNSTTKRIIAENIIYEYFIVMPDLFAKDGSL